MAALQARERERRIVIIEPEEREEAAPEVAQAAEEREWLIFQPDSVSSPSLSSAGSVVPASIGSSEATDWERLNLAGDGAQIGSLPAHDGQGMFAMDENEEERSLYASAQPDWSHIRIATDSDSTRLSFSTSSSGADAARSAGIRTRSHGPHKTQPLTEHALAEVPDNRSRSHQDEEAALTASSDDERLSDVEELLSRTPQAASAGIQTTPRARRRADHAGIKRRHRKSGLSDKGSKRSNASSGAVSMPISTAGLADPIVEQKRPAPATGLLLGNVVRRVFSVDEDLLELVATSPPMNTDRDVSSLAPSVSALPRAPARPSRFRRRVNLGNEPGLSSFAKHVRDEMGDFSGFAAGMTDSGEDTEMDMTPSFTPRLPRRSSMDHQQHLRASESSPARSLSLTSLPHLLESMASSLPSELLRSTPQPGHSSPIRRSASLGEAKTGTVTPTIEPVRVSYWRLFLQRLRAGLDITTAL